MTPAGVRIAATLALVVFTLAGCDGRRVRLGDAAAGSEAMAGFGGTAGASSGTGGTDEPGAAAGGAGASNAGAAGFNAGNGGSSAGTAGASAGYGGADAGAGGDGGDSCEHGLVNANEVVWIGDTWIAIPGDQHTVVRDHARTAQAIGPEDDYVILGGDAFQFMSSIADQYRARRAGPDAIKVLVMDGGTWDTIQASQSGGSVSDAAMQAASTFQQLLAEVADDGTVEHIIYFLVPALPGIPGVADLLPLMSAACEASFVPCHFLELTPLWDDQVHTGIGGIQASQEGAILIGNEIWKIMQRECIAQ